MDNNTNITQYPECNVENFLILMKELFGSNVTKDSVIQDICADDIKKMEMIQKGIFKRFGIHITIKDILNTPSIGDLRMEVKKQIDSPNYPVSEKENRRNQLGEIANDSDLTPLIGTLKKAGKTLNENLKKINGLSAPVESIGYHTKYDWLNKTLDTVDSKVSKSELKSVVEKVDENNKIAFRNIGTAIGATNTWIDAICEALIWIIQIENDLYDISEESSKKELDISNLLTKDGKNIEGLAEFSQAEKAKRQRMQQQLKQFKFDVEGKIEFLNNVHQKLKNQFESHKEELSKYVESINDSMITKVDDAIDNIRIASERTNMALLEEQRTKLSAMQELFEESSAKIKLAQETLAKDYSAFETKTQQQVSSTLSKLENEQKESLSHIEGKISSQLDDVLATSKQLVSTQNEFIKNNEEQTSKVLNELEKSQKENSDMIRSQLLDYEQKQTETINNELKKNEDITKNFMIEQAELFNQQEKQLKYFRLIAIIASVLSVASICYIFIS